MLGKTITLILFAVFFIGVVTQVMYPAISGILGKPVKMFWLFRKKDLEEMIREADALMSEE